MMPSRSRTFGKSLVVALVVAVAAIGTACTCHRPDLRHVDVPFDMNAFNTVIAQITKIRQGVEKTEWTPAQSQAFHDSYSSLPGQKRYEVLQQLAQAINEGKIKRDPKLGGPLF